MTYRSCSVHRWRATHRRLFPVRKPILVHSAALYVNGERMGEMRNVWLSFGKKRENHVPLTSRTNHAFTIDVTPTFVDPSFFGELMEPTNA